MWPEISANETVCLSVRTQISCSVAATKTGQAPAENHVKRITAEVGYSQLWAQ